MTVGELLWRVGEWLYGYWPFRIVHAWEQGVRLRFGKITKTLGPGLHIFWPVIGEIITKDAVLDVNVTELQTVDTFDGESASFSLALKYKVSDLRRLYEEIQDHDATIVSEVCASAAGLVGTMDYDALEAHLGDEVWRDIHERLSEWGIDLVSVSVYNLCRAPAIRLLTE